MPYVFTSFGSSIFRRQAFGKLRSFIGEMYNSSFDVVMQKDSKADGSRWFIPKNAIPKECSSVDLDMLMPEFMSAFLW